MQEHPPSLPRAPTEPRPADQEGEQHHVVDDALQVVRRRRRGGGGLLGVLAMVRVGPPPLAGDQVHYLGLGMEARGWRCTAGLRGRRADVGSPGAAGDMAGLALLGVLRGAG